MARASSEMLHRLLGYLLENASKYAPEDGAIDIYGWREGDRAIIAVTDDGPGIPAEACDRIFERFFRVDKARSREMGGTGLGLSIVKHIPQLHGGTARVESELGEGASFHLTFPTMGVEVI